MSAFQAEEVGSIPITRSIEKLTTFTGWQVLSVGTVKTKPYGSDKQVLNSNYYLYRTKHLVDICLKDIIMSSFNII